jgi:hypothetical protein
MARATLIVNVVFDPDDSPVFQKPFEALTDDASARATLGRATPPEVTIGHRSVGLCLQRLAIGRAPAKRLTGLNNEIHAEDLTEIARSIAKALDKDEGARRIEALDIVR